MSRASINNFVGIFGRQAPIASLVIPKWVTILVDSITEESEFEMKKFVTELAEGVAVVGAVGVTIAFNIPASVWHERIGEQWEDAVNSYIQHSRPYFRVVVCNYHALATPESPAAGSLLLITDGSAPETMPEITTGCEMICVDYRTTMVAKTARPAELIRDALEQVAEMDVRKMRHWSSSLSTVNLNSTAALLALNLLCKPSRFQENVFFFAYDYLDETVSQAFNDRTLRARWHKDRPQGSSAEESGETEVEENESA